MTYKFTIPGRLPNLNDFIKAERTTVKSDYRSKVLLTKGALMKKQWQRYVANYIRADLGDTKPKTPIDIHYTFYEPDRKRDKGNIMSFADKIICDALQDCGTIPNDNWANINGLSMDFKVDRGFARIEVELIEREDL